MLKECGIPDKEILKMATINAAEFLGLTDKFGEVKAGKTASLVLLNGNPLKDISNASKIEAVVLHGKVLGRGELDKMVKQC